MWNRSLKTETRKGARICGSSKQGKALLAPPGFRTVAASGLSEDQVSLLKFLREILTFENYENDRSNLHKSLLVLGLTWNTNVSSLYNLSSSSVSSQLQCTVVAVEDTQAPSLPSLAVLLRRLDIFARGFYC